MRSFTVRLISGGVGVALAAWLAAGCARPPSGGTSSSAPPAAAERGHAMRPLADVLRDHSAAMMRLPGVVGTGEGLEGGHPVFLVLVRSRAAAAGAAFPAVIEGYPVRVREVGEVRAEPR
jgi:hypothetical protein